MNRKYSWLIWTVVGAIAIAILASGIEVGDTAECTAGQMAMVNSTTWACIDNDTIGLDRTSNLYISANLNVTGHINTTQLCLNDNCLNNWIDVNYTWKNDSDGNLTPIDEDQNIRVDGLLHVNREIRTKNDTAILLETGQPTWAFRFDDAVATNTGLMVNTTSLSYEFKYLGLNLHSLNGFTGDATHASDLYIGDDIILNGSITVGTVDENKNHVLGRASYDTTLDFGDSTILVDTTDNNFYFSDGIEIDSNERLSLRDANQYIFSSAGGYIDIVTGTRIDLESEEILFGKNAGDIRLNFDGGTYDGVIKYWEDEDRFEFLDEVNVTGNVNISGDLQVGGTICTESGTCLGSSSSVNNTIYANVSTLTTTEVLTYNGTLTLGGTLMTSNENLKFDFESVNNRVTMSSGTSAQLWQNIVTKFPDGITTSWGSGSLDYKMNWLIYGGKSDGMVIGVGTGNTAYNGHIRIMQHQDTASANRVIEPGDIATDPTIDIYSSDATDKGEYLAIKWNQLRAGEKLNIESTSHVIVENSTFIVNGTTGTKQLTGAGTRMMFVPDNSSFRTGTVTGTQWDIHGTNSFAGGRNCIANNTATVCLGDTSEASGRYSTAIGFINKATGLSSIALGTSTDSEGTASFASGYGTDATGFHSTAMGSETKATNQYTTAIGWVAYANGYASTAMGIDINVTGNNSFGIGLIEKLPRWEVPQNHTFAILGGKVGIGTGEPQEDLHVNGTIKIEKNLSVGTDGDTFYVDSRRKDVGINNNAPLYELHIGDGTDQAANYIGIESATNRVAGIRWINSGKREWALFKHNDATSGGDLYFYANGIDQYPMQFENDTGNIHIGGGVGEHPTHQLKITGDVYTTSSITVNDHLNVTGNITGNQIYGEMWFHNDSSGGYITTINTQDVYENVTGFEQQEMSGQTLNGFTFTNSNSLTALVPGKYKIDWHTSFERASGGVGREYKMIIAINESEQNNLETHRSTSNANDVGSAGGTGFIDLKGGDVVTLQVQNTGGTENAGFHAGNVNLIRIGD